MIKNSLVIILIVLMFSGNIFIQAKNGYKLVWQDNFNAKYIDTTAWTHEVAKCIVLKFVYSFLFIILYLLYI